MRVRKALLSWIGASASACAPGSAPEESGDGSTTAAASTGADDGAATGESTGNPSATDDTTGAPPQADVTYHADIRAIVEAHCVSCHTPGNIAPFALETYEDVHLFRESAAIEMELGTMPPWPPGAGCQEYLGDLSLPAEKVELFRAWIDQGAVEGDPADYVPPDLPPPGTLSRVDRTLTLPDAYVPIQSPDDYRCFLLDWPETELTYVTGFRALPDDLQMVHHVIAYAIRPEDVPEYEMLDAEDPDPGYTCFGGPGGEITDAQSAGTWLGAWAPGRLVGDFPEGTGIPMEPGSRVVFQVHYNTSAVEPGPDQSSIELKIDAEVDRPAFTMLWANPGWLSGAMPIPAGEASVVHEFQLDPTPYMGMLTDLIPAGEPFRMWSAGSHMHKLGVRADHSIEHEDGSQTCLLSIPRWDFDWQSSYSFAEPIVFQPGDQLRLECEFDNGAGDATVNWGEGTADEMCLGVYYVTAL
jgi:mono/diheme cytochrome c family protein